MISIEKFFSNDVLLILYWSVAVLISLFWVFEYHLESKSLEVETTIKNKINIIIKIAGFFSDFIVSFSGWISLYILLLNIQANRFDTFNIFLASVAIISISGYGYKLLEKLNLK